MTGMLLYVALGLMLLTVLSNRYWRRQLVLTRAAMAKLKDKVEEAAAEVADAAADYAHLTQQQTELEKRVQKAENDLQTALVELDKKKVAPVERYFIFDRLEPRPGRFWEVAVRHTPVTSALPAAGLGAPGGHRGWSGIRRYLLVGDGERDARERVGARFSRKAGFEIAEVVGCRLNGLSVNRLAELSTFRKPGRDEDGAAPAKPTRKPSTARG